MDENAVKVIVQGAFDTYEKDTGKPRHEENVGNFETIFAIINKGKGVLIAGGVIVGIPAVTASLIVIIKAVRGH